MNIEQSRYFLKLKSVNKINLQQKRDVIELLLCSSELFSIFAACGEYTDIWSWADDLYRREFKRYRLAQGSLWYLTIASSAYIDHEEYITLCLEAAYRLIESSPTLEKEWFRE